MDPSSFKYRKILRQETIVRHLREYRKWMESEGPKGKQLNLEGADVTFARLSSAICCVSAKFGQMSKISVQEKIEASGSQRPLSPGFPNDETTAEPEERLV